MAGYWSGTLEIKQNGETASVLPAALQARLAQDGSQLILHQIERLPSTLRERVTLITFDSDSLILNFSSVLDGKGIERRYYVQGLKNVHSPFQWVIRRAEIGSLTSSRTTDIMQNDSLLIVTETSVDGLDWNASQVLRLGRREQPDPVRFYLPGYGEASRVAVVGDFNDWTPGRALMHHSRNGWNLLLTLPPGEYQYKFIVDDVSIPDRLATTTISDGEGGQNTIILVR
jgi:hypothetical protein